MDTKKFGAFAEKYASSLLERAGYKILTRNFRTKYSEIDIIATYENCLVFIEVKARRNIKFGSPEEAVNINKLRKITKAGELYALTHPKLPRKMRVDVVSLLFENERVVSEKIIKVF